MDNIRHLKIADTAEGTAAAGLDEFLDENIQRQVDLLAKMNEEKLAFINRSRLVVR